MFILEIIFEVIVRIFVEIIGYILFYILFGSIGAFVRWLFFQIIGKPRKMKELRTRVRKKRKKGTNSADPQCSNTTGDVFLGVATVIIIILVVVYFSR